MITQSTNNAVDHLKEIVASPSPCPNSIDDLAVELSHVKGMIDVVRAVVDLNGVDDLRDDSVSDTLHAALNKLEYVIKALNPLARRPPTAGAQ